MATQALSRRVRILHVHSDLFGGGIEHVLVDLVQGLPADRFEKAVCFFTTNHPPPSPGQLEELAKAQIKLYEVPVKHPFLSKYPWHLARVIRDFRPDVVHLHAATVGIVGAVVCRWQAVPVVVYTDHVLHSQNPAWVRVLRRLTDRYIDGEVCVSRQARDCLVGALPGRRSRTCVIHNGTQLPERMSAAERGAVRQELGFAEESLVIGGLGRLVRIKGYDYLIRALPEVLRQWPQARVALAGRGDDEARLRGLAAELGVANQVVFLGHREDVDRVLGSFDIYVQPSLTEALSISLIQAAGAGAAIVATNVGGNPEIVEEGVSGRLVPSRDAAALAQAICELAGAPELRRAYGVAARDRATRLFTAEQMVRGYEELYGRLLAEPARRVAAPAA